VSGSLFINPTAFEAGLQAAFTSRSVTSKAQAAAFERFAKLGLPNRRVEGWKWSDFHSVLRQLALVYDAGQDVTIAPSAFAALNPVEFRIVDGRVELPAEPLPEGLRAGVMDPVATIEELEPHAIATLNVAMTRKALGLEVGEGVTLERPILIRHINTGAGFSFAQTLTRLGRHAHACIIETYEGDGAGFYSQLYHLALRDGAHLRRYVYHDGGRVTGPGGAINVICAAKVDSDAKFEQTSLSTGAKLARHETLVHLWADNARANLNSVALLCGERHCDFTSEVMHVGKGCQARQLHKGVARDRGRNVFQGKFHVKRTAQKTNSRMTANALLLSDMAESNHKPELEIYADDVECAHGSTAGALDEDALFYLRQRGLDEHAARALLIEAFVGEVIESIADEGVRNVFRSKMSDWLALS